MSRIDVAEVIRAAAASSLGVLSLIVLAIAFIGYNFFKRSGDRVKAGVWAVMLLAAIGFGVAVVRQGNEQAGETVPHAEPSAVASPMPSSAPTAEVTGPIAEATGQGNATDVSGTWHDEDGYVYRLKAVGTTLTYDQLRDGEHTGSGQGTIRGRTLAYRYKDDRTVDEGSCSGMLSRDGKRIDGSCGSAGRRWGFAIER